MRTINHPEIKDNDLSVSLMLTPEEAEAGSYVKVVTPLDGEKFIKVPEGAKAGLTLRMQGLGSRQGNSNERGDLYVNLMIKAADEHSEESSFRSENPVFLIAGGCLIFLGVILLLGNMTGIMPTFPFAGFLVMTVGALVSRLGKISGA